MYKDEKRAFDALDEELRRMNTPEAEDDLADIYALLDKDYTKPARKQEPAPRNPGNRVAASGHESRGTRELSQELLEEPEEPAPETSRRSILPLAILAVVELAGIAAVIVWWLQWLG